MGSHFERQKLQEVLIATEWQLSIIGGGKTGPYVFDTKPSPINNYCGHVFSITLRTLLIAATNFSVLVAYCIWLVLILAIFLSEKYHSVLLKSKYN